MRIRDLLDALWIVEDTGRFLYDNPNRLKPDFDLLYELDRGLTTTQKRTISLDFGCAINANVSTAQLTANCGMRACTGGSLYMAGMNEAVAHPQLTEAVNPHKVYKGSGGYGEGGYSSRAMKAHAMSLLTLAALFNHDLGAGVENPITSAMRVWERGRAGGHALVLSDNIAHYKDTRSLLPATYRFHMGIFARLLRRGTVVALPAVNNINHNNHSIQTYLYAPDSLSIADREMNCVVLHKGKNRTQARPIVEHCLSRLEFGADWVDMIGAG